MNYDNLPMLRTSERKDFKRCVQRWYWRWRMGLFPRQQRYNALWFGTGIHLALERWYVPGVTRGVDPRETWAEFVEDQIGYVKALVVEGETPEDTIEVWVEAGDLGHDMLSNYLHHFGKDDSWEVISAEQNFNLLIAKPEPKSKAVVPIARTPIVRYLGTFDLVARDLNTRQIWLWDHKTAKSIRTDHLPMDDQAGSYWAVADHVLRKQKLILPRERINGILYNFLLKSPPDPRPVDELGRSTNNPVKKHYIWALMRKQGFVVEADPQFPETFAKMNKEYSLAELKSETDRQGIHVLGDVSKQQPTPRFKRHPVNRTRAERNTQIERIGSEATVMNMYRDGGLPLTKNPTRDCTWDCDFRNLCELHESGGDTESFISDIYVRDDPYAAHRLQERVSEDT